MIAIEQEAHIKICDLSGGEHVTKFDRMIIRFIIIKTSEEVYTNGDCSK